MNGFDPSIEKQERRSRGKYMSNCGALGFTRFE